jgi:hypothetical protein
LRAVFFREPFFRELFARLAVRFLAVRFLAARRFGAFAFLPRDEALRDFAFFLRAGFVLGGAGGVGV